VCRSIKVRRPPIDQALESLVKEGRSRKAASTEGDRTEQGGARVGAW
jgi:hypothetical protein